MSHVRCAAPYRAPARLSTADAAQRLADLRRLDAEGAQRTPLTHARGGTWHLAPARVTLRVPACAAEGGAATLMHACLGVAGAALVRAQPAAEQPPPATPREALQRRLPPLRWTPRGELHHSDGDASPDDSSPPRALLAPLPAHAGASEWQEEGGSALEGFRVVVATGFAQQGDAAPTAAEARLLKARAHARVSAVSVVSAAC
jgi:hypothetical protein